MRGYCKPSTNAERISILDKLMAEMLMSDMDITEDECPTCDSETVSLMEALTETETDMSDFMIPDHELPPIIEGCCPLCDSILEDGEFDEQNCSKCQYTRKPDIIPFNYNNAPMFRECGDKNNALCIVLYTLKDNLSIPTDIIHHCHSVFEKYYHLLDKHRAGILRGMGVVLFQYVAAEHGLIYDYAELERASGILKSKITKSRDVLNKHTNAPMCEFIKLNFDNLYLDKIMKEIGYPGIYREQLLDIINVARNELGYHINKTFNVWIRICMLVHDRHYGGQNTVCIWGGGQAKKITKPLQRDIDVLYETYFNGTNEW